MHNNMTTPICFRPIIVINNDDGGGDAFVVPHQDRRDHHPSATSVCGDEDTIPVTSPLLVVEPFSYHYSPYHHHTAITHVETPSTREGTPSTTLKHPRYEDLSPIYGPEDGRVHPDTTIRNFDISSSPPSPTPLQVTTLFPILASMTPLDAGATTTHYNYPHSHHPHGGGSIEEDEDISSYINSTSRSVTCQSFGSNVSNITTVHPHTTDTDHCREREVSSMGSRSGSSAGRSRSGLRLAKKERRQKAKDGQEGAEAFAGDDLGESCEDEGMTEILVQTPKHPTSHKSPNDWADSMLEPTTTTTPSVTTHVPLTTTTHEEFTKGRTNLRRGKRDLMRSWLDTPALGVPEEVSPDGTATGIPSPSIVGQYSERLELKQADASDTTLLSPTTYYCAEPSMSLSGVHVSITDGQHSPVTSMSSLNSSSMSVRHSRPRDTIRSIQALREATSTQASNDKLNRSSSPVKFMSTTNLYPNYFTRISQHRSDSKISFMSAEQNRSGEDVSTHDGSAGLTADTTISLQLYLHPGPKPRNVVTFNADAYNLDAWDADVMGLFALPTEGAPFKDKDDASSGKVGDMSLSIDPRRNMLSQDVDESPQTSFSILSAYFDQSRTMSGGYLSDPQVQDNQPSNFGEECRQLTSDDLNFDDCESLSRGDIICQRSAIRRRRTSFPSAMRERDVFSCSSSTVNTATNNNNKHKDYLLQIAVEHAKSTSQSLLLINSSFTSQSPVEEQCVSSQVQKVCSITKQQQGRRTGATSGEGESLVTGDQSPLYSQSPPHHTISRLSRKKTNPTTTKNTTAAFSEIVNKFVTLDALVHGATSYTEQLASSYSVSGHSKREAQIKWENGHVHQQRTTTD